MGSINRGTLPANFLDSVTNGMRLPQPEPRYMFAKMATAAGLMADALAVNVDSAATFLKMQGGGSEVPQMLDELARFVDAYPQGVTFVRGFGLGAGDTIKLRRQIFAGGGYTLADREVKTDVATSTTGQLIRQEEVPIVLKEYEGPFADGGTVPQPYIIREFDSKYKAAKDELVSLTKLHLLRDRIKLLDTVIRDLFRATTTITYADDVSNVLSFTAGAGHFISLETILKARKKVSDREWSPFQNGRYVCLVPTAFNTQMIGDPDYRALSSQHGGGKNQLFGYITSIQDVDIYECSTLKQYAAGATVPTDTNTVPTSATVEEALLFGPGVVGMGQAQGPTAFDSDDTNYGKEAKVIWRSIEAFQTLDIRGCERILFQSA
jgi:hypothetical protein